MIRLFYGKNVLEEVSGGQQLQVVLGFKGRWVQIGSVVGIMLVSRIKDGGVEEFFYRILGRVGKLGFFFLTCYGDFNDDWYKGECKEILVFFLVQGFRVLIIVFITVKLEEIGILVFLVSSMEEFQNLSVGIGIIIFFFCLVCFVFLQIIQGVVMMEFRLLYFRYVERIIKGFVFMVF